MDVRHDLTRERLVPNLSEPRIGVCKEKTLVGSVSVDQRIGASLMRFLEPVVADHHTAEIGDVFTEARPAIHVEAVEDDVVLKLVDHDFRLRVEPVGVSLRPPVTQVPRFIELTPLVVESVRHFVPDRRGTRIPVDYRVIDERIRDAGNHQSRRREDDLVV